MQDDYNIEELIVQTADAYFLVTDAPDVIDAVLNDLDIHRFRYRRPAFKRIGPSPKPPQPWLLGLSKAFTKSIKKIDQTNKDRVLEAMTIITDSPIEVSGNTIKPLKGKWKGCWRYRLGSFRIIYKPDINTGYITLILFDSRGSIY